MNESNEDLFSGEGDELARAASNLARAIAPARDLWPGIEQAIAGRRGRTHWSGIFAQAAAVLLLVGGSSGITWLAMTNNKEPAPESGQVRALQFEPVSGSFGSRYHLGPEFMEARNKLAANLDEGLARLSPETRVAVRKNIAAIRTAISEINRALAEEPDNALLQDLLLRAYQDELSLMRKIDGLQNPAMRRTDI